MLDLAQRLFQEFHSRGIRYCHWKSNISLEQALTDGGEFDLLVDHRDSCALEAVLALLGFKSTVNRGFDIPSTRHFFGFDHDTGTLVHVHVYHRLITGENLTKNYWLPLEALVLENTRTIECVRVPIKTVELLLFILRIYLKQGSLFGLARMQRDFKNVREELVWLVEDDSTVEGALSFLNDWLPSVDLALFKKCVQALSSNDSGLLPRFVLALRMRACLRIYRRHSLIHGALVAGTLYLKLFWNRFVLRRKPRLLCSGGAIIAFVGPEATGKSTLIREIGSWLGKKFSLVSVRPGKPTSSCLTLPLNLLYSVLWRLSPGYRANKEKVTAGKSTEVEPSDLPLLYIWRAITVAWDRRNLLIKAARRSANGKIVICDRYPSSRNGAMDSPRLRVSSGAVKPYLARVERLIYEQIPPPNLVIRLVAPVEVAVQRNATRQKSDEESEEYVRRRHSENAVPFYPASSVVHTIDTNQPLENVILAAKQAIWNFL